MPGTALQLVSRLNVGGPARHLIALCPALGAVGWDVTLACGPAEPREGDLLAEARAAGLEPVVIERMNRSIRPWRDAAAVRAVAALIDRVRPDVLHTHTAKAGAVGRVAARVARHRPPVVLHTFHGHVLHSYYPAPVSRALALAERGLARGTAAVTAVSPSVLADLRAMRIAPEDHLRVLPVAIQAPPAGDRAAGRAHMGVADDGPLVTLIGRLVRVKRVDRFLDAAALVSTPGARFAVVGDGPEAEALAARPSARALGERLRWTGVDTAMGPVLAASDVVVQTSDNEGTPVALLEAALAGVPVVGTPRGGIPDVIEDGQTGLLAAAEPGAIAAAIDRLLGDPALAERMAGRARERVAAEHAPDAVARRHVALYEELLSARSSRGASASNER